MISKTQIRRLLVIGLACVLSVTACTVSYKFTGASISPDVKTISIRYFQNRAEIVEPSLAQSITEALIDKCRAQTSLSFVNGLGDVDFEGEITAYDSRPLTVGGDSRAATNRFSITVKVKYTNSKEPELSYDQSFTRYEDYDSSLDFRSVEAGLSSKIIELLIEDIFNRAFVNW